MGIEALKDRIGKHCKIRQRKSELRVGSTHKPVLHHTVQDPRLPRSGLGPLLCPSLLSLFYQDALQGLF